MCPGLPPNRQLEGPQRATNKEGAPQGGGQEEAAPGAPTPQAQRDGVPGGGAADTQSLQPLWENTPTSRPAADTTVHGLTHCPERRGLCVLSQDPQSTRPAWGRVSSILQPWAAPPLLRAGAGGDPAMRCFPAPRLGWGSRAVSRGSQGTRMPSGDRDTGEDSPRGA